jgi:hypothetical protein
MSKTYKYFEDKIRKGLKEGLGISKGISRVLDLSSL